MDTETRSARDLRKVGAQASGSPLLNERVSVSASHAVLKRVPSFQAGDGQVLTADGLGFSDWENVDGGGTAPGGTEHLVSLLHFDGLDNGTNFDDDRGLVWSRGGAPILKTAQKKFGLSSGYFDGVDDYIGTTVPAKGTTNFCFEMWVYPIAFGAGGWEHHDFLSQLTVWNGGNGINIGTNNLGQITLYSGYASCSANYNPMVTTAVALTINDWNHVALVRVGNLFSVYINGIKDAHTVTCAINISSTQLTLGYGIETAAVRYFQGYIDEFAAWDYARYTINFIPPTLPFTLAAQIERGTVIQFRRGNAVQLPPLFSGEPFIELDTGLLHIGDFIMGSGAEAVANLGSTAEVIGAAHDDGVASTPSRSDHKHEITVPDAADLVSGVSDVGDILTSDGVGGAGWVPPAPAGVSYFHDLTDTFEYAGLGGQFVKVNAAENALETAIPAGGGDVLGPAGAVDGNLVVFDGVSGTVIKDGGAVPAGGGDVSGPAGATAGNLAVFDGATGKILMDGGAPSAGGGGSAAGKVYLYSNFI